MPLFDCISGLINFRSSSAVPDDSSRDLVITIDEFAQSNHVRTHKLASTSQGEKGFLRQMSSASRGHSMRRTPRHQSKRQSDVRALLSRSASGTTNAVRSISRQLRKKSTSGSVKKGMGGNDQ